MGASVKTPAAASAAQHADDLARLLDIVGVDAVTVLSHAGGSPVALEFAVRHRDRTSAVVVVDFTLSTGSGSAGEAGEPSPFGALLAGMVATLQKPDGPAALRTMYGGYFGSKADPALTAAAIDAAVTTPMEVACAELIDVIGINTEALARQITAPVLWVTATTPDAPYLQSAFSDLAIGVTPGSGHFVQLEVPNQLNAMIETFLAQNISAIPTAS